MSHSLTDSRYEHDRLARGAFEIDRDPQSPVESLPLLRRESFGQRRIELHDIEKRARCDHCSSPVRVQLRQSRQFLGRGQVGVE